jgi:hypothetical protein
VGRRSPVEHISSIAVASPQRLRFVRSVRVRIGACVSGGIQPFVFSNPSGLHSG